MAYGIVYKITNLINNKVYIGITTRTLKKRIGEHITISKSKNTTMCIHRSIAKYGINSFKWEIIDKAESFDELNNKERYYIVKYNSLIPNGYNCAEGGTNGYTLKAHPNAKEIYKKNALKRTGQKRSQEFKDGRSGDKNPNYGGIYSKCEGPVKLNKENKGKNLEEIYGEEKAKEIKQKLSEKSSGKNNVMYGKTHTPEARDKIRKARTGTKLSEEQKKNLSIKNSGENNAFYGKKHSKDTKEKMKLAWAKRSRKFICIETGIIYNSVAGAHKELGVDYGYLWKCLKLDKKCKGFHYKYLEKGENK